MFIVGLLFFVEFLFCFSFQIIVQISEEDFQNVLDRVATSKDFATVRDNILFFLQVR